MTLASTLEKRCVHRVWPGMAIDDAIDLIGPPDSPRAPIARQAWSYVFGQLTVLVENQHILELQLDFEREYERAFVALGDWASFDLDAWCAMGDALGARAQSIGRVTVLHGAAWRMSLSPSGTLHRVVLLDPS